MIDNKKEHFHEQWLAIEHPAPHRPALVIDASDASNPVADEMLRFATDLIREHELNLHAQIYFLGNCTPYPIHDFLKKGRDWYHANAGRLSLIGPVLKSINGDARFLILTAGKLFDYEDCPPTSLFSQRVTIIAFGNTSPTPLHFGEQIPPDPAQVRNRIDRRVTSVAITGDGYFPFFWSNSDYRWDNKSNRLIADKTNDFLATFGLSAPRKSMLEAVVTLSSGELITQALTPTTPDIPSDWAVLSDTEARVVRECVLNGQYACPLCMDTHRLSQITCRARNSESFLGRTVLPELEVLTGRGFILFDISGTFVRYRLHPCPHLRCSSESIAIARPGTMMADIWRPAESRREWEKSGRHWEQFTQVGDTVHAILL